MTEKRGGKCEKHKKKNIFFGILLGYQTFIICLSVCMIFFIFSTFYFEFDYPKQHKGAFGSIDFETSKLDLKKKKIKLFT